MSYKKKRSWLEWILQNQKSAERLKPISTYCATLQANQSGTNRKQTEMLDLQGGFLILEYPF